jgi:hypothetical protein
MIPNPVRLRQLAEAKAEENYEFRHFLKHRTRLSSRGKLTLWFRRSPSVGRVKPYIFRQGQTIGRVKPYIFAFFIHFPVVACALSDDAGLSFMARCNRAFAVL